jgi:hypothetical protein
MHACACACVRMLVRARTLLDVQVKVRGNQCEVDNILTESPAFMCRRIEIGHLLVSPPTIRACVILRIPRALFLR